MVIIVKPFTHPNTQHKSSKYTDIHPDICHSIAIAPKAWKVTHLIKTTLHAVSIVTTSWYKPERRDDNFHSFGSTAVSHYLAYVIPLLSCSVVALNFQSYRWQFVFVRTFEVGDKVESFLIVTVANRAGNLFKILFCAVPSGFFSNVSVVSFWQFSKPIEFLVHSIWPEISN